MDYIVTETSIKTLDQARKELNTARALAARDDTAGEAQQKLQDLLAWATGEHETEQRSPHHMLFHESLMQSIDRQSVQDLDMHSIGLGSENCATNMLRYADKVATGIDKYIARVRPRLLQAQRRTAQGMAARALILLSIPCRQAPAGRRLHVPILTPWVIKSIWQHLQMLKPALQEVSGFSCCSEETT